MTVSSINNVANALNVNSLNSTQALTDATKNKLEALGVDTSKIKTESEGQLKLKEAQSGTQSSQNTQQNQQQNNVNQIQQINEQVKLLASQVGVEINKSDNLNTVLNNISAKIQVMAVEAVQDPQKLQQVKIYQDALTLIKGEVAGLQAQKEQQEQKQQKLASSMDIMASYNKMFFNL